MLKLFHISIKCHYITLQHMDEHEMSNVYPVPHFLLDLVVVARERT
jgi:hypothetical protein